ncbi:MAG: hypothetical protein AB8B57_15710 [Congregibacter sp.]
MCKIPGFTTLSRALIILSLLLGATQLRANGEMGDHVNDLDKHLDEYADEVSWLIEQVDGIVNRYAQEGSSKAAPADLVEHWEAVKFHAAIESNFIPIYSSIWQGLFGVRLAIEGQESVAEVRGQQALLEQSLWQALGAVKLAASLQKNGALATAVSANEDESPQAALVAIKQELDRVVAKYAERLPEEAVDIVHDTYMSRFEGIEGRLIEEDADLVEDLEVDFNVSLPKAIQDGASVDIVRQIVNTMQEKLDAAGALLEAAQGKRSSVF